MLRLSEWRFSKWMTAVCILVVLAASACSRTPEERRQRFIKIGLQQMEKKDYARAILEFTNASQSVPNHPEAYYQLGMAHLAAGDVKRGYAFLRRAVAVDPKYAEAQIKLSELMIMSDNPTLIQDAQDQLTQLLATSPNSAEAITALAATEWKLAQPEDAEKHLMEALDKVPGHLNAAVALAKIRMQQKDFANAEKILRSVADQKPPTHQAFIALGEFYKFQGRSDDAAREFRRALEIDPINAAALTQLASAELVAGRWAAAEAIYQRIAGLPDPGAKAVHALFLLQSGKLDAAIREFKTLVDKYPADRAARSGLVTAYIASKRLGEAEGVLNAALTLNGRDVPALLQRASLRISQRNWGEAETDLQNALRGEQDSPQVHYLFSKLYGSRQDLQRQRQALDDSLRADASFLSARLDLARLNTSTRSPQLALDLLDRAPETQRNVPAVIAERNWAYLALGKSAEAEKGLKAGLPQQKLPDFLIQDAILKLQRKQLEQARTAVRAVLNATPNDIRGLQLLLLSYQSEGRENEGLKELKQFAAGNSSSFPVQQFVGAAFLGNGQKDEAREAFKRAKIADPSSPFPYLSLAQLDANDRQFDQAKSILRELLSKDPKNALAYLWLGHIAVLQSDYNGAVQHYRATLGIDTNNISALNNLAFLLSEHIRQPDQALEYAQKARELAPASGAVANTLGMVYYNKGLYTLALPLLRKAVELEKTPSNTLDLGLAYYKSGDTAKGRAALTSALKLDSRLPKADQARQLLASSGK